MKKTKLKIAIKEWLKGKKYNGFHPTGYNEINWTTVRKLEKLAVFNSTKCCATGTCRSTI